MLEVLSWKLGEAGDDLRVLPRMDPMLIAGTAMVSIMKACNHASKNTVSTCSHAMIYLGRGVDYNLSSPTYTRSIGHSSSLVVVILAFQIRVPLLVAKIVKISESDRPSAGYIYRRKAADTCASDILLCSEDGTVLIEIEAMTFAGI